MTDLNHIVDGIQHGRFTVDEMDRIVDAVKFARAQHGRRVARTLKVGDRVQYQGRNGHTVGILEKINIKKAIVRVGASRWNVPLGMLEAV
jgi:tRNA(Ile2) C34 agmatinyltransferase TiaS